MYVPSTWAFPDALCGWARIGVVACVTVLEEHGGTCQATAAHERMEQHIKSRRAYYHSLTGRSRCGNP